MLCSEGFAMRYLILSDIHANLAAFDAVLADVGHFDKIWCLGDMVGYGPQPNECIERLREFPHICIAGNHDWAALYKLSDSDFNPDCIAGNHDWAALYKLSDSDFNPDAQWACRWTREKLLSENFEYLDNLPTTLIEEGFTLVHGSPRQPIWEYILHPSIATSNFAYFDTQVCLVGHTHTPVIFRYEHLDSGGTCLPLPLPQGHPLSLGEERMIINPGSVGQPRDGDPWASYAILDTDEATLEYHRIPYPVEITQRKMMEEGLPIRLIARLGYGW
jgi:predicted phosphodiesterase